MKTLEVDERIKLGKYTYRVIEGFCSYFLFPIGGKHSVEIFKEPGTFLNCKTLEDLTKFVEAIKEELGEWELPEKWCIRGILCGKDANKDNMVLREYFDKYNSNYYISSPECFYYIEDSIVKRIYTLPSGYTEITFEQFKKYVLMKDFIPERLSFYLRYSPEFTEDLYNKLMEWCKVNSKGIPRKYRDCYKGLQEEGYFVFDNWGLNSPNYDERVYGYGVDNNSQGCKHEYTIEQVKQLIGYKSIYVKVINTGKQYTTHSHAREYGMTNYFYWTKGASRLSEGNVYKVVKEVEVNNYDPSFILIDEQTGYEYLISKKGCKIVEKPKEPKQQTMKKEIIGYKLKESCEQYKEAAKRVAANSMLFQNTRELYGYDFTARSQVKIDLEKTGVLDLWFEPVYKQEEEFKIGDLCYVINKGTSRLEAGKVYPINEINLANSKHKHHFDNGSGRTNNACWLTKDEFRRATPEEIKEYKNNLLLEEAKKRYPLGCSYIGVNSSDGSPDGSKYTPTEIEPYWYGEGDTIALQSGKGLVYACGKWAEIIATPDITINGYKAEFHDTCVQFGCVKVDLEIVNQIHNLLSNKSVDLTAEKHKIKKIVEYYQNK